MTSLKIIGPDCLLIDKEIIIFSPKTEDKPGAYRVIIQLCKGGLRCSNISFNAIVMPSFAHALSNLTITEGRNSTFVLPYILYKNEVKLKDKAYPAWLHFNSSNVTMNPPIGSAGEYECVLTY